MIRCILAAVTVCTFALETTVVARASSAATVDYTVVHTKLGDVRGAVRSYGNMTVREFLGIRYAQPPTGGLRFSKPLPVQPWSPNTYDALSLGSWCPQSGSTPEHGLLAEDCLFLNVYAPYDGPTGEPAERAVMIFVHGGGFKIGSSSQFIGSGLASVGDVVVVTVNYRLNVFGFLSTSSSDSPGNYGLWDQRAAFAWVRDNIAAFGGDPTRITIFGQSAGAASMTYQALSPQNDQTLFQRVIVESGSCHSPWAFLYSPLESAMSMAQKVDCPTTPSDSLVECLRSKSMYDLLEHAGGLGWAPSVDGEFVLDTPDVMTQKVLNGSTDAYLENFSKYDYLVGFNSQEALMFVDKPWTTPSINDVSKNMTGKDISDGLTDAVYSYAIQQIGEFYYYDNDSVTNFVSIAKYFYEKIYRQQLEAFPPDDNDMLRLYVQIASDFELVAPTVQTLNLHAKLSGVGKRYQYLYDLKRSFDEPRSIFWEGPDWLRTGADHEDELSSVFAYPLLQGFLPNGSFVHHFNYTDAERWLSAAVIQYWTNYAKTGNPNTGRPLANPWDAWPTYDLNERMFLHIMVNQSSVSYNAKSDQDFLWNDIVVPSRNRFNSSTIRDGSVKTRNFRF